MYTLTDFENYVFDFYGPDGIYPMPQLTRDSVARTVQVYLSIVGPDNFEADSVDRERVRDILLLKYNSPSFESEAA
jgi:hypothetical protein